MSGSDHPVEQPAGHQLMVELLRCRDQLAPQLPQFNERRPPLPLMVGEDPVGLYEAVRLLMDEVHDAYVLEYGARRPWRRVGSEEDAVALLQAPTAPHRRVHVVCAVLPLAVEALWGRDGSQRLGRRADERVGVEAVAGRNVAST